MIPRRFYILAVFSAFALLSFFFFFLNRNEAILSVPASVSIPESWKTGLGLGGGDVAEDEAIADEPAHGSDILIPEGDKEKEQTSQDVPPVSPTDEDAAQPSPYNFPPLTPLPEHIDIAVIDTTGSNEEVATAFIHAFGVQPHANMSLYLKQQPHGIGSIIKTFNFSSPVAVNLSSSKFHHELHSGYHPSIVVATSCEKDLLNVELAFAELLAFQKTYLFCVINDPEQWKDTHLTSRIRPWMDLHMVDFVTLSQHTGRYFRTETVDAWNFNATMNLRHLSPVFPVKMAVKEKEGAKQQQYPISVYGDHNETRHNYTDILGSLASVRVAADNASAADSEVKGTREVSLKVYADGTELVAPSAIKSFVHSEHNPANYQSFYESVSKSYILLPAFAGSESDKRSEYLTRFASWSVPLSLIAGVPLASNDDLLEAYHYLPREATWFRFQDSEMKLAERVIGYNATDIVEKKEVVRKAATDLIQRNVEEVDYWIQLAMMRVQKAGWPDSQEAAESS